MSTSAGAEEDEVSEAPNRPYIPGDEVSLDLGQFEHDQNLIGVRAVYVNQYNTQQRIELRGNVEPVEQPGQENPARRVRVSRATVTAIIENDVPAGRYFFQAVEGDTFAGESVVFEPSTEHMERLAIPAMIQVQDEPMINPRFR